jgi:hypothetical protein
MCVDRHEHTPALQYIPDRQSVLKVQTSATRLPPIITNYLFVAQLCNIFIYPKLLPMPDENDAILDQCIVIDHRIWSMVDRIQFEVYHRYMQNIPFRLHQFDYNQNNGALSECVQTPYVYFMVSVSRNSPPIVCQVKLNSTNFVCRLQ